MLPMAFDLSVHEPEKKVLEAFCGVVWFYPLSKVKKDEEKLPLCSQGECVLAEAVNIKLSQSPKKTNTLFRFKSILELIEFLHFWVKSCFCI